MKPSQATQKTNRLNTSVAEGSVPNFDDIARDIVILNQASLLQRAEVIRTWGVLYQRDAKRRVQWEARAVMDYLEFQKYDDVQSKALAERTKSDRFAVDSDYVRARLARLREYTQLLEDTRRQAIDRMVQNATLLGATAVISMRFDSSEIGTSMSEIVAYGTAVILVPDASAPQPATE